MAVGESGETPEPKAGTSDPFDPCFLTAQSIDDYLRYAASADAPDDPRFAVFGRPPDWSDGKDRFPLALCEFLAYKSVLAYYDKGAISDHLKRCRGIRPESYQFFDSSRSAGDTQGYGFVIGDTAFIVMRGSASLRDWMDDFSAALTTHPWVSKTTLDKIGGAEPARHLGFARAWANAVSQIEEWAKALPPDVTRFCFSGHSLGGALAIMGAHDFARRKIGDVAAVVTFAAPKAGGRAFADHYDHELGLGSRTLRLESDEDAVPWVGIGDTAVVGSVWRIDKRPMIGGWEKFWAALLGIAGWTPKPAETSGSGPALKFDPDKKPSAGGAPSSTSSSSTTPSSTTATPAKNAEPPDNRKALAVLVAIVIAVVVVLVARKAIIRYRAHGAAKRYALYLTTLSYRRLRDLRLPATSSDDTYRAVSADLDTHLDYIRGKDPAYAIFRDLRGRPIRILSTKLAERYAKETGKDGGYERYIW